MRTSSAITAALALGALLARAQQPPPFESVGLPDRFVCTLSQRGTNGSYFAGAGGFKIDCTRLLFTLNLAEPFTNVAKVLLSAPSRLLQADPGTGQPVQVSLCAPVQVPGETNGPPGTGCEGYYRAS